jgi:DNA invertase Pin-like site-specific DNA recombinase
VAKTKRIGVSYARFSDPKQAKGDSEDRQAEMFRDFCERHELTPHHKAYLDPGRSGYDDTHRKKGDLGRLLAAAKAGAFEAGTVIVVEAWDRLGRLRPDRQTELIAELLRTGVSIGVCRLNDVFTEEDFGSHKWTTLSVFTQLAYQESKQKAERVASSWKKRRKKAREDGTLVTGRLPAWLTMVDGKAVMLPDRVDAVRRIYELAAAQGDDGRGRNRIVGTLINAGVRPFGWTGKWTRTYVHRILTDRRVLGEYQPHTTDGKPAGGPIPDYYPRVVEDDVWELAQAAQEDRRRKDKRGRALVRGERKRVNLFRGLLTNAADGGTFFLHRRTDGVFVLCNFEGACGRGKYVTFPYTVFEEGVLRLLREVDPKDVLPRDGEPSTLAVLTARRDKLQADVKAIQADLDADYSKALTDVLRKKEAAAEEAAELVRQEQARTGGASAAEAWQKLPGLADMVKTGGDAVRLRLRPVLRHAVRQLLVLIVRRGCRAVAAVRAHFDGAGHRDWIIVHQARGFGRAGGWGACSAASVKGGAAPLFGDLRNERAADWLGKALAGELPGINLMALLDADEPGAADRRDREAHKKAARRRKGGAS